MIDIHQVDVKFNNFGQEVLPKHADDIILEMRDEYVLWSQHDVAFRQGLLIDKILEFT